MKPNFYPIARLGLILLVSVGSGCQISQTAAPEGAQPMTIQITSTAFTEGNSIPQKFTCDSEDISPPLAWTGIPAQAKSLALIVDDPDAPGGVWVHWVVFDMPPSLNGLPEGVAKTPIRLWHRHPGDIPTSASRDMAVPARQRASRIVISSGCMRWIACSIYRLERSGPRSTRPCKGMSWLPASYSALTVASFVVRSHEVD